MCGIAGFFHHHQSKYAPPEAISTQERADEVLSRMQQCIVHRGPDDSGKFLTEEAGLAHVRLAIIDPAFGSQPITRTLRGKTYTIVYNGETYNMPHLRTLLALQDIVPSTNSDTEVVLLGFLWEGPAFLERMNGIFAFAIYCHEEHLLYLCRDRFGVKPLFYTFQKNCIIFASEPKALFAFPGIRPKLSPEGMGELFALGPAHTPGKTVYDGIFEVLPGHILTVNDKVRQSPYYELPITEHTEGYEDTVAHVQALLYDAIELQMLSDVPVATFLSGGLDSSLVTALCSNHYAKLGKTLDTYSFDFEGNDRYFQANDFQPSRDRPYVDKMVETLQTKHHYLSCSTQDLLSVLYDAVDAHDAPCMADVESSLLFFCRETAKQHKVVLTGECADEVFGGYPWFHREELFWTDGFPWSYQMDVRESLLLPKVTQTVSFRDYSYHTYQNACATAPMPEEAQQNKVMRRQYEISYLNLRFFMQTLLDRMDRTSMYAGLEARVPFADHRLVSYLYNVPWELRFASGVKGLLKDAAAPWLMDEVRLRKKSPYPKTYHPAYEQTLGTMLQTMLRGDKHPLSALVCPKKLEEHLSQPSNVTKPWYGQLMAGPQLLAYLLQVGYWLEKYQVEILW